MRRAAAALAQLEKTPPDCNAGQFDDIALLALRDKRKG
jgi:hypothetical protein